MGISYNDYEPTERKEREVEETADFVVNFRRLPDYNGEFGFDWMRDNYKEICADYEKLKCEYTPEVINDAEYFVPWISMFPNQQNVKLKLEIDLKTDTLKDDDIIKLPSKNGISFEPNQIKALEIDGKEIKVNCSTPLTNDVFIDLLDQDNKIIGKLNLAQIKKLGINFKLAKKKQMDFSIFSSFLPEELLFHFDIVDFKELGNFQTKKDCFFIYLDEKN
ncbi:hypothetical protein HNQ02_002862, partial [Flavobacterium sp. 7E]|nr:hypothetical protein [Flavobacterium sp. 7E]